MIKDSLLTDEGMKDYCFEVKCPNAHYPGCSKSLGCNRRAQHLKTLKAVVEWLGKNGYYGEIFNAITNMALPDDSKKLFVLKGELWEELKNLSK
jgi:hypothetical protein